MEKKPFLTLEQAKEIIKDVPTPFHVYDEKGIRENARALNRAFAWNKGYKEFFAVKATPNPYLMKILQEEGCGMDCSSYTELMLCESCGITGSEIMFSSNVTPTTLMWNLSKRYAEYPRRSAAVTIPAACSAWRTVRTRCRSWILRAIPSTA